LLEKALREGEAGQAEEWGRRLGVKNGKRGKGLRLTFYFDVLSKEPLKAA